MQAAHSTIRKMLIRCMAPLLLFAFADGSTGQDAVRSENPRDFGVLLMAHGGPPDWNRSVLEAVEPLRDNYKLEVAFGMADAASIQEGIRRLEAGGVRKIGVVRLFVSGESWAGRTEQILGLAAGAPEPPAGDAHAAGEQGHDNGMAFWKVRTSASFALSERGLAEAPEMGAVLAERAQALSHNPELEDILILAHGPGDDAENGRWITHINTRAEAVRTILPFRRVQVETLREDSPDKRKEAERRIRAFVQRASDTGGRAIVIPFRVQGFGPYAKVLSGLDYISDGVGLLPHPGVTNWIEGQIKALQAGPFRAPTGDGAGSKVGRSGAEEPASPAIRLANRSTHDGDGL